MKKRLPAFLLPRLSHIFFLAVLFGALFLSPRMLSIDSDLGRHLTLGQFILGQREIPTADILSHTKSGEARPPYEWLTQVLFALAYRLANLDGVILLCALTIAAGFTFVYADSARRSNMPVTALWVSILTVAASSLHWLPRPHVVTFLFLALWLERLERVERREKIPFWQFPLLMLVWANAHGGFIFGMLAWLAYLAGWGWEKSRGKSNWQTGTRWLIVGVSSLAASFLTPSGWGNWQAVLNNNSRYILNRTVETMRADFSSAGAWPFVVLIGLSAVVLATRKTQFISHIFLLGGFALLGLLMGRNIPLFAIASAPILSEGVSKLLERAERWKKIEANIAALEKPLRGAVWPILFGLGIVLFVSGRYQVQKEALTQFNPRVFPVAAADWLVENPQTGNMFNEFNWGGYLLYRLWPGQKVFLDSQTDFYGEEMMKGYEQVVTGMDWETAFERYAVEWVVVRSDSGLAQRLRAEENWQTVYEDNLAVILRRVK